MMAIYPKIIEHHLMYNIGKFNKKIKFTCQNHGLLVRDQSFFREVRDQMILVRHEVHDHKILVLSVRDQNFFREVRDRMILVHVVRGRRDHDDGNHVVLYL